MQDNIHERVLRQLEASKGRWSQVSEGSGVSKRTIEKIARKEIEDPGVSHIQKLNDFFNSPAGRRVLQ